MLTSNALVQQTIKRYATLLAAFIGCVVLAIAMLALRGCFKPDHVTSPINGSFGEVRGGVTIDVMRHSDTIRDTITRTITKIIPIATPSVLTDSRAVLDTSVLHSDATNGDTLRVPLHVEYQRDSNRFENIIMPAFTMHREREVVNNYIDRTITVEIPKLIETKDTDDWWWFGAGAISVAGGYFITKEAIRRLQ
jgi:hypothetical protein